MIDLEYTEIDGLLYPNIDTGAEVLKQLGKYGQRRLEYIHGKRPELYRELLLTGKLAEHCEQIEAVAFKISEQIQDDYVTKNPLPDDDFFIIVRNKASHQAFGIGIFLNTSLLEFIEL